MNNGIKYKWSKDFNKKLRLVKPEKRQYQKCQRKIKKPISLKNLHTKTLNKILARQIQWCMKIAKYHCQVDLFQKPKAGSTFKIKAVKAMEPAC